MQSHLDRTQMHKNQETRRAIIQRGILGGTGLTADGGTGTTSASGRRPRGPGGGGGNDKKPCFFFNHGGCKFDEAGCSFKHVIVSDAEKAKMEPLARRGSRSPTPERTRQQPQQLQQKRTYCQFHLKGKCTKSDDCLFLHVEKDEVERQKQVQAKAKAEAKAKAKVEPKAKAKAKAQAVHVRVPAAEC